MESLLRNLGLTEEDLERARGAMGRRMRAELDAVTEQAAVRTMAIPGYESLHIDQVRPNTRRAMQSLLATLEGGEWADFGANFQAVALMRAREGLPPGALRDLADLTEGLLCDLVGRSLDAPLDRFAGALVARRICDLARAVIVDTFEQAHAEARAAVDRLARQFSAPILPALPGVLVLPIVGAVPPARARQILDSLLDGVVRHAAHTVVLDITGATDVEPALAADLQRLRAATGLLGARLVLVGVAPGVARVLLTGPTSLAGVPVHATLADALLAALRDARAPT